MTEDNTYQELSEQDHAERTELFRYTDLSHPLMQTLFNLQLNSPTEAE